MEIKVYKPQSEALKKIIDCFYILRHEKDGANTTYITFPSVFTIVSLSPQVKEFRRQNRILNKSDKSVTLDSTLVCKFSKPRCYEYEGEIVEITIYFKPLGLNSLLDKELCVYADEGIPQFIPFSDFTEAVLKIFTVQSDKKKIAALEKYLLSKFKGFDHPFLVKLINDLSDELFFETSLAGLAKKNHIIPKTMLKHFEKHICKTPSTFRKIVRFRNALHKYVQRRHQVSLTELTYMLNYFDQSHFIKEFKSLTGYAPRAFFKSISQLGNGKINWIFI
jgi:AraC-like DNA-binding protein